MCVLVSQLYLTLCNHGLQSARLICPRDFPGKNSGVDCHFSSPGDLPDPWIKLGSPPLYADSSLSEPPERLIYNILINKISISILCMD